MYGIWLAGSLISQLGDSALYFGLGWAASASGGSPAGLVLSAITLPRAALVLVGGVVGDRSGARKVMIIGDAVMLVVALTLGLIVSLGNAVTGSGGSWCGDRHGRCVLCAVVGVDAEAPGR